MKTRKERASLLRMAVDLGISYFDVAPLYGDGLAERALAEFLGSEVGLREKLIVATKWGLSGPLWVDKVPLSVLRHGTLALNVWRKMKGAGARPSFTTDLLFSSVESSLRRLKMETIDILWMHEPTTHLLSDPDALLRGFEQLREQGKVRYFGVAGFADRSEETLKCFGDFPILYQCDEAGWSNSRIPEVTFGAISRGPQSRNAPKIPKDEAIKRLLSGFVRRPSGVVLSSTTSIGNLEDLATAVGGLS